jgi:hypothetical protein
VKASVRTTPHVTHGARTQTNGSKTSSSPHPHLLCQQWARCITTMLPRHRQDIPELGQGAPSASHSAPPSKPRRNHTTVEVKKQGAPPSHLCSHCPACRCPPATSRPPWPRAASHTSVPPSGPLATSSSHALPLACL